MESHLIEWLNLAVRWLHMTAGIAWIGASFYFNWLEHSLERKNQRAGIAGSLWAVHGGGFYYLEKYLVAPQKIPETLHWFKWEAYWTWISGFALMVIVYYWNASLFLVGPESALNPGIAIILGIVTMGLGWIAYDLLCRSPLGRSNFWIGLVGYTSLVVIAFGLTQVFEPRAAYIHVGALIGTCMVANVFFVIIPNQKMLVAAGMRGDTPNAELGKKALQRSLHNNYMTLPVLFIMISNHFPTTYGHQLNWLILAAVIIVGAAVRHWFNLKNKGHHNVWLLPLAAASFIALGVITYPKPQFTNTASQTTVTFAQAYKVIGDRCRSCHSNAPVDDLFKAPPAGVEFDSPQQIKGWAERIKIRAVVSKTMPFANKTGMTDEERAILGDWIDQGALIE